MKTLPSCETNHCPLGKGDTYMNHRNKFYTMLTYKVLRQHREENQFYLGYEGPIKKKEHEFGLEVWCLNLLHGNGG